MNIRKSALRILFEICNTCFMLVLMLCTLYPFWYLIVASFSGSDALVRMGNHFLIWPVDFNLDAYQKAFANPSIYIGLKNSLFVVGVGVTASMVFTSIGAYFLSRKNTMLCKPVSIIVMFTMWFSGGLIPFYIAVRDVNLLGSLWSLILPTLLNTYNMIILRTAFDALPSELEESAYLDGAGHLTTLFRIFLPLSKATLAVVALYYGVGYWNSWFNASIFLQGRTEKWPLQLVLRQILIINDTESMTFGVSQGDKVKIGESIKYAVIIISILPIICAYPFIQKYFVKGIMIGAVKG